MDEKCYYPKVSLYDEKGDCKLKIHAVKCFINLYWEGGAVASWLVRSSPDRVVRVQALAGDIGCVLG